MCKCKCSNDKANKFSKNRFALFVFFFESQLTRNNDQKVGNRSSLDFFLFWRCESGIFWMLIVSIHSGQSGSKSVILEEKSDNYDHKNP